MRTYLRSELGRDVQWASTVPVAVDQLPAAAERSGRARVADQYMFNFCTYSYSTAHWGWDEWQREIDWMAMHGITMPLALVGHEAVLFEAFVRLGLSEDAALAFLGDPVYLPFQFMGCIEGDHAVMTRPWVEGRRDLGRRIVDRLREFAMEPILPAFTGHVPGGWATGATTSRDWQGNTTWFLDPDDARFVEAAATVAAVQRETFGAVRYFAADPFIEMTPVDDGRDFPALVGRRIIDGIAQVFENPVWVMQAWPFSYQRDYWTEARITSFLDGIDDDDLLVLDLWAESDPIWPALDGFRGKSWHWCGLLNFGGRSDAIADLPRAANELERALASDRPPTGIGLSMESIHHNAVFFELLCDLAWAPIHDLGDWIGTFASQRYGTADERVRAAWLRLLGTVFDTRGRRIFPEDFHGILTRREDLLDAADPVAFRSRVEAMRWFEPGELAEAWQLLTDVLDDDRALCDGPLGHDLVEIGSAAAVRAVDEMAARILEADDDVARQRRVAELLDTVTALDVLLSTRPETRLDVAEGLAGADAGHGVTDADLRLAQRRILTSWNGVPGTALDDYSGRIWHGLVGTYYRARLAAWAESFAGDVSESDRVTALAGALDAIWSRFMARDGDASRRRPGRGFAGCAERATRGSSAPASMKETAP